MGDALGASTTSPARRTTAPHRLGVGIVWLDRVSLLEGRRAHPAYGPTAFAPGSLGGGDGGRAAYVGTTVEVPPGYLVVDVRLGYAEAAGAFVGELRVADGTGAPKSALLVLERTDGASADEGGRGPDEAALLFVDARTAPRGERILLSVWAAVVEEGDGVVARGLRLQLARA